MWANSFNRSSVQVNYAAWPYDDVTEKVLLLVENSSHAFVELLVFRSESPSQAFLAAVTSLYHHVTENNIPPEKWHEQVVVYDNICNLNRIKAARIPLPLRPPFDQLWLKPLKCLDVFHLRNHTSEECHTTYHPDNIKQLLPDLVKRNTQAAEQINAMLGS